MATESVTGKVDKLPPAPFSIEDIKSLIAAQESPTWTDWRLSIESLKRDRVGTEELAELKRVLQGNEVRKRQRTAQLTSMRDMEKKLVEAIGKLERGEDPATRDFFPLTLEDLRQELKNLQDDEAWFHLPLPAPSAPEPVTAPEPAAAAAAATAGILSEPVTAAEVAPPSFIMLGLALYDFYEPGSSRGVTESPQTDGMMRINSTTHNIEFSTLIVEHSFTPTMSLPLNSITECYTRSLTMNPFRWDNFNRSGQVSVVFDFGKIPVGEHEVIIEAAGGRENGRNKILIHPITENKMGDGEVNMRYFHTKILEAARVVGAKITRAGGKKSRGKSKRHKRRKYNKRRKSTKRKYTKRRKSKTRRRRR